MKHTLLTALILFSLSAMGQQDTTKAQPDSVRITLSLAEFQEIMQKQAQAANLSKSAKASEQATATVFILQNYEVLTEKAKPVYKTKSK